MQGWRISMEDAHAAVLDLQAEDATKEFQAAPPENRLSFFGVYDGHGGDKVALFAGENIHKIIAKQEAFKNGDYEQALKDGFLATDRAILNSRLSCLTWGDFISNTRPRPKIRRGSIWMYRICWSTIKVTDLCGTL
jgi:serine/threonine protein phosphatase PrpC